MKYILVKWPESKLLLDKSWFNECLLVQDINGHEQVGNSTYMVPELRYEELCEKHIYVAGYIGHFINNNTIERVLGIYTNKEDAILKIQSDSGEFESAIENGDYPEYKNYTCNENLEEGIIDIKSKKVSSRWYIEEFDLK